MGADPRLAALRQLRDCGTIGFREWPTDAHKGLIRERLATWRTHPIGDVRWQLVTITDAGRTVAEAAFAS